MSLSLLGDITSPANTIHTWRRKVRKTGSTKLLPTDQTRRIKELEARVEKFSTENDRLKRIVAEKELQIVIMEGSGML